MDLCHLLINIQIVGRWRSENTAAGVALIPGRQRLLSVALLLAPVPWLGDVIVSAFRAAPLPTVDFSKDVLISGTLSLATFPLVITCG